MRKVQVNTTLDVVGHALLNALAEREDPTNETLNTPLMRLLREEAQRVAPGAWDRAVADAKEHEDEEPRELSVALQKLFREAIREARR